MVFTAWFTVGACSARAMFGWGTVHDEPATNAMSYIFDLIIMAWVLSIDLPSVILFPMRIRLGLVVFQFPGCGVLLL